MGLRGNEYDLREAAGAFGDLGTLIPFLVGYLTISKLDPVGVLVAFGLFKEVTASARRSAPQDAAARAFST